MAKSLAILMQEELGQLHFQLVIQTAEILKLREENEKLMAQKLNDSVGTIVREPDKNPKLPPKEVK